MVEGYPTAVFGKPNGSGSYQIIEQPKAFEKGDIARAFHKICGSFEWKSTMQDVLHAPCYGILLVEDQFLIARYTDDGRDPTGRPHTLRIECVLTGDYESTWQKIAPGQPLPKCAVGRIEFVGDPATFNCS